MSANDLLRTDHAALRKQLDEIQNALSKSSKKLGELFPTLQTALQAHFRKEDSVYYRIADETPQRPDRELMHALRNDHAAVLFTLESLAIRLRKNSPLDEWGERFKKMLLVLHSNFEREEKELFPFVEATLPPERQKQIVDEIQRLA